jgi:hypothetical protein
VISPRNSRPWRLFHEFTQSMVELLLYLGFDIRSTLGLQIQTRRLT